MTKVCALCDAGFKTRPMDVGIPLLEVDGHPVPPGSVLMLPRDVSEQIKQLFRNTNDEHLPSS